jgi:hypothetical protein
MADVERIELQVKLLPLLKGDLILPYVIVDAPQVYAHRDASGRANWDFGSEDKAAERRAEPAELPVVQKLAMENGKLEVRDDVRKLVFRGTVRAREDGSKEKGDPFLLEGKGELNGRAFDAKATGGSLITLDAGEPYPFELDVNAADIGGEGARRRSQAVRPGEAQHHAPRIRKRHGGPLLPDGSRDPEYAALRHRCLDRAERCEVPRHRHRGRVRDERRARLSRHRHRPRPAEGDGNARVEGARRQGRHRDVGCA